ncbi:ATPase [Oceanicola sp. D3]|nr:ATPase [Oceanicola sp. D3]
MTCLEGLLADPIFLGTGGVSLIALLAMIRMLRVPHFNGQAFLALTFVGVAWALAMVGLEAASTGVSCQMTWATLAWLGNALVPVAWCFFVFAYLNEAGGFAKSRLRILIAVVPAVVFAVAATNPWHHLVYGEETAIPAGQDTIRYSHGPAFFAIIASLYVFVMAGLVCIARAFTRARRTAWPLLAVLALVTITPLLTNAAYVGLGLTVFGLDPTAFMFTLGILVFTWMLMTSKTMDMANVGQSVLFDKMSEPVALIDRRGAVVLMNSEAKRRDMNELKSAVQAIMRAKDGSDPVRESSPHLTIGQRVYEPRIQEIENPLDPLGNVLGWSITFVDITDRLAINSALEQALKRADDANRAKDEFISFVSHEMRTPLTSLRGGLTLALSGHLGDLSPPLKAPLTIAHRNCVRLARLVDNILLAQKLEIGALSLEEDVVDLESLLDESFQENSMFAKERDVQLSKGSIETATLIKGDAFAVRQIIDNLVSNAIKFSHQGGIVEGRLEAADGQVRLSIRDHGRGIPSGLESKVFGRFDQVPGKGPGMTQGSGLGLHISRQLAAKMAGNITYESSPGAGTTFFIEFPQVEPQRKAPARCA